MKKILVIEDDPEIREHVATILQYEGFQPLGAENGRRGLSLAKDHLPDLIVCDVNMPDMNGYSVLNEIRADALTEHIPFIFLTGKAATDEIRQGMQLGADDYLTKPFSADDLIAAIHTRLNRHAAVSKQMETLRLNLSRTLPHELRTPLIAILGFSNLLITTERKALPDIDEIIEMQRSIYESALRLQRLIENYLLYANLRLMEHEPETRSQLRHLKESYMEPLITYIGDRITRNTPRKHDLIMKLTETHAPIAEDHFKKIFTELLDNAFKFSEPGTPVKVQTGVKGGNFFLRISDQGRGMSREQIANIGAYMQFNRQQYEQQGSGLGLAIVHLFMQLYGGALQIDSELNHGTSVTITVPYRTRKHNAHEG